MDGINPPLLTTLLEVSFTLHPVWTQALIPGYKEDRSAYGNGPDHDAGAYPMAPFAATGYTRSNSVDTMATADLVGQGDMRRQSGYGDFGGQETPYRDGNSPGPELGGYGQATLGGDGYPRQQTYRPVNLS